MAHAHCNSIKSRQSLGHVYQCVLIKACSKSLGAMETEMQEKHLVFLRLILSFGPYFIFHYLKMPPQSLQAATSARAGGINFS